MTATFRRTPLAMAILGLLEDGPLHPYGMQRLFKQWGKDQVVNVGQRATLYKVITRLAEAGLIRVHEVSRDTLYPERTAYELTEEGREVRGQWLAEALAEPRNEFPEFPAALSYLPLIAPEAARELLARRRERLALRLAERDALIEKVGMPLPKVSMLETTYLHAVVEAEIAWLDGVLAELRDGSLTWDAEELRAVAAQLPE